MRLYEIINKDKVKSLFIKSMVVASSFLVGCESIPKHYTGSSNTIHNNFSLRDCLPDCLPQHKKGKEPFYLKSFFEELELTTKNYDRYTPTPNYNLKW
ncbi:hypothetical protein HYV50_00875 [Candidatus Pacearchaeota archaeon]|nr:hypothetical protein [Candidatus Pacearchaeota archaeon]